MKNMAMVKNNEKKRENISASGYDRVFQINDFHARGKKKNFRVPQ